MSTNGKILNKVCVCLCCSNMACGVGACYDSWTSIEAYGLCYLNCQACCWTLCAPVCHECKMGDTKEAMSKCMTGLRYCAFCCLLDIVAPFDGCINCVLYARDNCTDGVSGFKDVMKNTKFLGDKVKVALDLETSNEPGKTYGSFTP